MTRLALACLASVWTASLAMGQGTPAQDEVLLFRVFLTDGSTIVSYGEFVRVGDEVVISMPIGTDVRTPALQLLTIPAAAVNWERTNQYSQSVRYQHYANTRAETDFAVMSAEIAGILNEIAVTTDRQRAIEIADDARRRLAAWPAEHLGYRAADIADIVRLIDEAMGRIEGGSAGAFQVSLIAAPTIAVEPVLGLPPPRDQIRRLVTLADGARRSSDRIAMLRAAIALMDDAASGIAREESADLRRILEGRIQQEIATDEAYAKLASRLMTAARRSAARARVSEVQQVLAKVADDDLRLGGARPETVAALRAELQVTLEAAQDLRLRRDQWTLRRRVYRAYVDSVSAQISQLVKAQTSLEHIRQLSGPSPGRLQRLQRTLRGGAERLQQMAAPEGLREAHDVLVSAWRFAESAVNGRHQAILDGDIAGAWQASSAAAGSLLLLSRAQGELRDALTPPVLR
jgi:hypothetical protein